jgi:hypothetical protein
MRWVMAQLVPTVHAAFSWRTAYCVGAGRPAKQGKPGKPDTHGHLSRNLEQPRA